MPARSCREVCSVCYMVPIPAPAVCHPPRPGANANRSSLPYHSTSAAYQIRREARLHCCAAPILPEAGNQRVRRLLLCGTLLLLPLVAAALLVTARSVRGSHILSPLHGKPPFLKCKLWWHFDARLLAQILACSTARWECPTKSSPAPFPFVPLMSPPLFPCEAGLGHKPGTCTT